MLSAYQGIKGILHTTLTRGRKPRNNAVQGRECGGQNPPEYTRHRDGDDTGITIIQEDLPKFCPISRVMRERGTKIEEVWNVARRRPPANRPGRPHGR